MFPMRINAASRKYLIADFQTESLLLKTNFLLMVKLTDELATLAITFAGVMEKLESNKNTENCIIYQKSDKRSSGEFKDLFVYAE